MKLETIRQIVAIQLDAFCSKLNAIAPFEEVKTNRLHIAIASVILGKKTTLYDNIYFKKREIYKYSIAPHFSDIRFDS